VGHQGEALEINAHMHAELTGGAQNALAPASLAPGIGAGQMLARSMTTRAVKNAFARQPEGMIAIVSAKRSSACHGVD
jgi:hypothetical protein